jgi:predicted RNA-binding Zn-ribbon protein involved in translation (DUF1610 family)
MNIRNNLWIHIVLAILFLALLCTAPIFISGKWVIHLFVLLSAYEILTIVYILRERKLKNNPKHINCPFCRIELEIPPKANGQKVQCPECGNKFITRKHSLNKFKLDFEKVKWFFSTIREYQILLAGILLSMAIIIYAIINYNTDRYYLHKESQRVPLILDKNAGKLYSPVSYNWILCDPIKKARK